MPEQSTNKYSLWIVLKGAEGEHMQQFVDTLTEEYDAPRFVPHLTLVGNILINSPEQYHQTIGQVATLAANIMPFYITLYEFGYTEEEFRCLFLRAAPSLELDNAYMAAEKLFPQVADEHFRDMPHASVLYGNYDTAIKQKIITEYRDSSLARTAFRVETVDLFLTNSPIKSWQLDTSLPIVR